MPDIEVPVGTTTIPDPPIVPGDNIYFLGGGATVTGVNHSDINRLAILEVPASFSGTIGSSGTPLVAGFSTHVFLAGGVLNLDPTSSDISTQETVLIIVVGGVLNLLGTTGKVTTLYVQGGRVNVGGGVKVANYYINNGSLLVEDGAAVDPDVVENHGGSLVFMRGITPSIGRITHYAGTTLIDAGNNNLEIVEQRGSGLAFKDAGVLASVILDRGIPDLSKQGSPLSHTALTINMSLQGAQAYLDHSMTTGAGISNPTTKFSARAFSYPAQIT